MMGTQREAAIRRIRSVATELGEVRDRLVFIGGTVLPLLVDVESRCSSPRVTKDVDAVAGTASYTEKHRLEQALRLARFRDDPAGHMSRWRSPSGEVFDLSFAGSHAGGSGSRVDAIGIRTAIALAGEPAIRHLSPTGFFLMKAAAFFDRGLTKLSESKDLADLAVLFLARHDLPEGLRAAGKEASNLGTEVSRRLLAVPDFAGALRVHFRDRHPIPPDTPDLLAREVLERLTLVAG
jgi:hypothetical protein